MKYKVTRCCPICDSTVEMAVTGKQIDAVNKYLSGFGLLQECLPDMDKHEREFIKTGYCLDCQELIFGSSPKAAVRKKFTVTASA